VGSKTFDGVWFISYSRDHLPPHVHGKYAEIAVVIDLLPDGKVRRSQRWDAVEPADAKRSHVRHVLEIAAEHAGELMMLWEKTHGSAS
jgi:hypothetical protein